MTELNLMAVVRLSGLSEHVLRAWEKRYQAVTPKRAPNGRRLYSLGDLEKLKLLAALVHQGYAIRNIASLSIKELQKIQDEIAPKEKSILSPLLSNQGLVQTLIHHLEKFDLDGLDHNLRAARFQFSPKSFVLEIAAPVMLEAFIQVATAQLSIAHENALFITLRNHLAEISRSVQSRYTSEKSVILCAPEVESHEFWILLSRVLFTAVGWKTYYLGVNLPVKDLIKAALIIQPQVIFLGCSPNLKENRRKQIETYLSQLDEIIKNTPFWMGGAELAEHWCPHSNRKILRLKSLEELAMVLEGVNTDS